jgi:hypothetical protein
MLMKRVLCSWRRWLAAAAAFGLLFSAVAGKGWAQDGSNRYAAADCYSIGLQVASDNGGTLAKASATTRDGQTYCVIVVLVPAREGQRPRRAEFVVAAE